MASVAQDLHSGAARVEGLGGNPMTAFVELQQTEVAAADKGFTA